MPRKRRAYVPKQKGCYECSQRRIHCDRKEPQCQKCLSKGIACSGLGIRYRFIDDVTAKHTLVRDVRKAERSVSVCNTEQNLENKRRSSPSSSSWDEDSAYGSSSSSSWLSGVDEDLSRGNSDDTNTLPVRSFDSCSQSTDDETFEEAIERSGGLAITSLDTINPFKVVTLNYFSHKIATELVVIDDGHNGWRYLVLPIAQCDELVMDAVLSASSFHYHANFGECVYNPSSHYMRAINKLQKRQNLESCDTESARRVILAILVLLVTVMINGSSDFPIVFRLLRLALDAVGSEEALFEGELGGFIKRQIRKLSVYAAPFLSRSEGAEMLSFAAAQVFECLLYYDRLHPEYETLFSVLIDLGLQAQSIYLKRITTGPEEPAFDDLVEKFKHTLSSIPPGSPGEHTLVWATFMAASESSVVEHQQFFRNVLLNHHRRNGFLNIRKALIHLERIWSRRRGEDWTSLLPEPRILIA